METTYETVKVTTVEINEDIVEDRGATYLDHDPGIMELLGMIGHLPLRDQVYMTTNLLTISGFKQREIAEVLGVAYKTYRNRLLTIRKDMIQEKLG